MKQSCSVLRLGRAMAIKALPCSKASPFSSRDFADVNVRTVQWAGQL